MIDTVKRPPLKTKIRWAVKIHLPAMTDIEEASSDTPWTRDDFVRNIRRANCIPLVAEHQGVVAGFAVVTLQSHRINILNMAVSPDCRHRKVGTQLIENIKDKLSSQRRSTVNIVIPETRMAGAMFLAAMGFRSSLERDYFPGEDGIAFVYEREQQPRVAEFLRSVTSL